MRQLAIIGAGGHGKVVADIAKKNGYDHIVFLDDNRVVKKCGEYDVVGNSNDVMNFTGAVFVAVGNAKIRKNFIEKLEQLNITVPTLIHPNAIISEDVSIGSGTVVVAGAIINPGATIGKGCIVNTSSSVDHDCNIGDYVHVAVGAHVAGTVSVGECTWIGAGATVSNNVNICSGCMIGAGAVVVKDIEESGTYVGVPAKRVK